MNASLLGGNAKPSVAPAAPVKKGNGMVIGATIILIIVLCVVIYWFWFKAPAAPTVDISTTVSTPDQGSTQGAPPVQPQMTIPASTQPAPPVPAPSLQGAPPVQPQMTIPATPTPTPVQPSSTPGGVTCAAPNPSNIPTGSYLGKCCNCGMGTDPGTGYDPTALTCDCQTPFNTVSHTTKGIAFCGGKDIYVDQNGRLNC
jgi:hypothetical protein